MRGSLIFLLVGCRASSFLHDAVQSNDPTGVRSALANGADINELSSSGHTPLMEAVLADKLRAGAALMKMGADATVRDADGFTPLHKAAQQGNGKIVRMLLRYKVDATDMHADGLTPFHRACAGAEAGHTDAVFAFLDAGVAPDRPSAAGTTPIDMSGSENTRKLLAEALHEQRRKSKAW